MAWESVDAHPDDLMTIMDAKMVLLMRMLPPCRTCKGFWPMCRSVLRFAAVQPAASTPVAPAQDVSSAPGVAGADEFLTFSRRMVVETPAAEVLRELHVGDVDPNTSLSLYGGYFGTGV